MKIAIFAAGTGGHIYPALTIAKEFNKKDIIFFASSRKLEKKIFRDSKFKTIHLKIDGFRGKNLFKKLLWPFSFFLNLFDFLKNFIEFKPDKILVMGGYISIFGVLAALIFRKKIYIHEQNSVIGTLNKFAKNFSHKFFSSFQNVASNEIYTGNPIRNKITTKGYELNKEKKSILVLGGSQGANFFNEKLMKVLEKANFSEEIIFQTGRKKAINSLSNIKQVEYIDEIEDVFAQTKFVICRSGASTVAELQTYAMPAIFIPIHNSIDDHQTVNAKNACKNGGGIYLSEKSFSEDLFLKEITSFYNSDLNKRSKNMFNDIHKDAASRIANEIKQN